MTNKPGTFTYQPEPVRATMWERHWHEAGPEDKYCIEPKRRRELESRLPDDGPAMIRVSEDVALFGRRGNSHVMIAAA